MFKLQSSLETSTQDLSNCMYMMSDQYSTY